MNLKASETKAYIKAALKDKTLRQAVDKATQTALQKRAVQVEAEPAWEELRHKAHAIKCEVLEHLDAYLELFEKQAIANGMQVHWASDAAEAQRIVQVIVEENDVRSVVKSKSLTSEEIHLNKFLSEQNVETLETDLGEYIVQLLDQIPSHLTAPALHLSRQDIGKIFQQKLGVDYTEEPTELLAIARAKLREKFLAADMGISGVNFGIAASGCLVILENEANARLAIGLPRTHVALMGIEKLIPSFQELPVFLKLLAPSATGQKQTVYVNVVGTPLQKIAGEGPEQLHIILLDNGRSKILADPQLRETLCCIRCGACLNVCPIYQQVGGHAYGWVYMGPIGATLIPQYLGEREGRYAPFLSSLCGACHQICPVRINIPHHLLKLRKRVVDSGNSSRLEKLAFRLWAFLARHPKLYRTVTWFPGKLQLLSRKPFPVPAYCKERALGTFDVKGFRKRFIEMEEINSRKVAEAQRMRKE
ncbi:iron-sulfur cluster-binding protein [candidate division KSB1 bacterium]|nr:iron-sulfur cluster-binding protein [candidate division KSB1 bacterium]RQW10178.1 MAG: iron-sulfur cluster-binding protein [candidate division KSB1 bacterium]